MATRKLCDVVEKLDAVDCDLSGSKLVDVNLARARFTDVSLRGARFTDVDLRGVAIVDADLRGLTIDGVRIDLLLRARERSLRRRPRGRSAPAGGRRGARG